MNKESLIESANQLVGVTTSAVDEHRGKAEFMVAAVNKKMLENSNILLLVGPDNASMMKGNHSNHAKFISSILESFNPKVLVETLQWVFQTYQNHGFHPNYFEVHLSTWLNVITEELSAESSAQIVPYYEWMIQNIPNFIALTNSRGENK